MKALILPQPGSHHNLRMADVSKPTQAPDELLVRVYAAGLNPVDYKVAKSGRPEWSYPFVLGVDAAGVVEAVGKRVDGFKPGDQVYYHGSLLCPGGFAEYATVPAHAVAHMPAGLGFEEAAALPCAGFTAYQATHRKLHLAQGATVLVHGGAGGVGGYAIQLARVQGWRVITTCSPQNAAHVQALGADHSLDYRDPALREHIIELTNGQGVDAFIDAVGGDSTTLGLNVLAFNGSFVGIVDVPDLTKGPSFDKALSVHMIALNWAYLNGTKEDQIDLGRIGREFGDLVAQKKVKSLLGEVVAFAEIPTALDRLSQRHVRGKIVAKVAELTK